HLSSPLSSTPPLPPPTSPPFPYTTLFRSYALTEPGSGSDAGSIQTRARRLGNDYGLNGNKIFTTNGSRADLAIVYAVTDPAKGRSEEHTSELQSRVDLVCRLLLEKNKDTT